MKTINSWTPIKAEILDNILDDATQMLNVSKASYLEYIVLYPNGYGFSVSKVRPGYDKWEIIMVCGTEVGEIDFYYESEITNFDVVSGLSDEDVLEMAKKIKEYHV